MKWTEQEVVNFIEATERVVNYISVNPLMFRKTNKQHIHEALITSHNLLIYKMYSDRIFWWLHTSLDKEIKWGVRIVKIGYSLVDFISSKILKPFYEIELTIKINLGFKEHFENC